MMPNDTCVETRIQDDHFLNPSSISVSFPSLFPLSVFLSFSFCGQWHGDKRHPPEWAVSRFLLNIIFNSDATHLIDLSLSSVLHFAVAGPHTSLLHSSNFPPCFLSWWIVISYFSARVDCPVCVDTHALVQHFLSRSFPCLLVILLVILIYRPPGGIYWLFIKIYGLPYHVKSAHCTNVMKVNSCCPNDVPMSWRLNQSQLGVSSNGLWTAWYIKQRHVTNQLRC